MKPPVDTRSDRTTARKLRHLERHQKREQRRQTKRLRAEQRTTIRCDDQSLSA